MLWEETAHIGFSFHSILVWSYNWKLLTYMIFNDIFHHYIKEIVYPPLI